MATSLSRAPDRPGSLTAQQPACGPVLQPGALGRYEVTYSGDNVRFEFTFAWGCKQKVGPIHGKWTLPMRPPRGEAKMRGTR